ncbi:MAG: hypothetical protein NTV56_19915 [Alphaproteobacteria bacterium]|nr:hypothetical protein [Alphaproteobacteria bacterium]
MVYEAFLVNDGIPRELPVHPAYLTVAMMAKIYRFLHAAGLLTTDSLSTLPPGADRAAFDAAWTAAVRIARLLSFTTAIAYVLCFAFLMRRLIGDWRIAWLSAFFLAFSGGFALSMRAVKTELLPAALVTTALIILIIAAQSPRMKWRPLLVGAGALLATLALENKVQAIFVIAAFPILLLPFGQPAIGADSFWSGRRCYGALAALAAIAILALLAAMPLLREGITPDSAALRQLRMIFGAFGVSQAMLAFWTGLGILVFAWWWRVPMLETMASGLSVTGGIAAALLALYIVHDAAVVVAVLNPLDQLFFYGAHSAQSLQTCGSVWCPQLLWVLLENVGNMLTYHSFVLHTSTRPAIFVEWLAIVLIVVAWRRGERKLALQASLLIAAVWGIDTLQATRALKQEYFNFNDPLILIACAVLVAKLSFVRSCRFSYPVGTTLIALHVVFSQAEPVKHQFKRGGPETKCDVLTLQRVRFPFCPDWKS